MISIFVGSGGLVYPEMPHFPLMYPLTGSSSPLASGALPLRLLREVHDVSNTDAGPSLHTVRYHVADHVDLCRC